MSTSPIQTRAPLAAWYALAALSVAVLYSLVDGQVLTLLVQPLKTDLHLSDTQIGSLRGLGSTLFATIAVVPLGWLADKIDRRLLLAMSILVWSGAVASCGLASGYWSLLLCVALLGAGEASLTPVVYSMIPELFPQRQWMSANFIFYAATLLGAGAGYAIAGAVIDHISQVAQWFPTGPFSHQTWRQVFVVVALPGPFLALAIGLIRMKRRVSHAQARAVAVTHQERPELRRYLVSHWKALVAVFAPIGLALLGASAFFTWLPVILMRQFALSAGSVGAGFGSAVTIASITGLAAAAVGGNCLKSKWGAVTPLRLMAVGYLIFGLLSPLYLAARSPTGIYAIATLQIAAFTGGNALMPTVVQNLAPAELRGRVFAISRVIATSFPVVSPIAVGLLSDRVFHWSGGLLLSAIMVGAPSLLLAGAALWLAEKPILKTVDEVSAFSNAAAATQSADAILSPQHP